MPSSTAQPTSRGVGPALRAHLVDATITLIDESQDEARISLRAIARAAGGAAPSIYPHFPDRDAVLGAALEQSWHELLQEIIDAGAAGRTPRTCLLRGCRAYVDFADRHPLRYALMTRSTVDSPAAQRALAVLTTGLARTVDPEAPTGIPVTRGAAALSAALHGLAILHRSDSPTIWLGGYTEAQILETVVDAAISASETRAAQR
jgi:AcrR family transcriptional regulator